MRGQVKGQFIITQSNGSVVNGQQPTMRVRLAASGVVVAHIQSGRGNLVSYMRNHPKCDERKQLENDMIGQGFTVQDVYTVLSREV